MIGQEWNLDLDVAALDELVKRLEGFRKNFDAQIELYVNRLMQAGYQIANVRLADAKVTARSDIRNDDTQLHVTIAERIGDTYLATLTLDGKRALFIEFGAGATLGYGHPKPGKYGPGTYNPDSPNWSNPGGWWYTNDQGESRHTYGNKPYAPIYGAREAIEAEFLAIARQTFR